MCNLYNVTTNQEAIRRLFGLAGDDIEDTLGNLEPSVDVYPDRYGPVVRNMPNGKRQMAQVRWGLPTSQEALYKDSVKRAGKLMAKGREVDFDALLKSEPDGGTTNVRNTKSKHWTRWLGVENRCVVPFSRFAEPDYTVDKVNGRVANAWFAGDEDCPLMFFAGIWVPQWTSVRKVKTGFETVDLYGFLTTTPNRVVGPIHNAAMPVILRNAQDVQIWLTQPWAEASYLQRPLPDDELVQLPAQA